jgi:predicted ATPase
VDVPLPNEREAMLAPDELRRLQLAALTNWVIAGARTQPVVLAVEDLHWADPTTLDVLKGLAERGARAPLFVVATTRPEFRPPWGMRSHHGTISLVPLDRAQVRDMVAELSARHALPPDVVDDVVARTGGVPLFVEEVTRLLLDRGAKDGIHVIPPSLQQSLMARLDRLGPAREVAQIGSVIGRGFSYDLLRTLAGVEDAALQAALEQLAETDILLVQGLPPDSDYRFKHALIQDAAYENLLKSRRQVLHRRVAEILCDRFPETAMAEPEALAHHFTQAGLTQRAVEWRGKAGYRSLERSALVEAAEHFTRALDQLAHLPSNSAIRRERINLQIALINPLMHIKGHAAPEARAAVERARLLIEEAEALGEPLEDPLLLFSVLYGSWIAHFVAFNGDLVLELAAEFLALAERRGVTAPLMIGHRIMGMALLFTGHIAEGCANLDRAISLYDPVEHRQLATRFSVDPAASSLFYQSQALWCLGYPEAACAALGRGLKDARQIRHAATLMFALHMASTVHVLCRNYVQAAAGLDELAALTDESGAPYWRAFGMSVHGCLLAANGKAKALDAAHMSTTGISALRVTGTTAWTPWYLSSLARAYAELGRFDDARHSITEALTTMEMTKETWCASEIHRTAGEIALMSLDRDTTEAQACFDRALTVARAQQAKSWELRAAMSIARLWRDQGRSDAARELLAPVYEWFTEGFDTFDLRQAKALLAELAQ